jgi:uncharacterized protein HemY
LLIAVALQSLKEGIFVEHKERLEMLSCEGYCTLGNYHKKNRHYKQAEDAFRVASNMIPIRIRPQFYLWELYVETGNRAAAVDMAQRILASPVKIESIYTLRVKRQMREYLAGD